MRFETSAKRWNHVFANQQNTAIVKAWNVMNTLLSYLESQEGRMALMNRPLGCMRPALVRSSGASSVTHRSPVGEEPTGTGRRQDRFAIGSW
jgi:hypothetical protein